MRSISTRKHDVEISQDGHHWKSSILKISGKGWSRQIEIAFLKMDADKSWRLPLDMGSRSWKLCKGLLIFDDLGTYVILVHLGKQYLGIFEILNDYGTSWKINILESLRS